jgi:hypothetical protein
MPLRHGGKKVEKRENQSYSSMNMIVLLLTPQFIAMTNEAFIDMSGFLQWSHWYRHMPTSMTPLDQTGPFSVSDNVNANLLEDEFLSIDE